MGRNKNGPVTVMYREPVSMAALLGRRIAQGEGEYATLMQTGNQFRAGCIAHVVAKYREALQRELGEGSGRTTTGGGDAVGVVDERLASTDRVHVDVTAWSASTEGMASGTCGFGCDLSSTSKVMVGSGEHGEHTGAGARSPGRKPVCSGVPPMA